MCFFFNTNKFKKIQFFIKIWNRKLDDENSIIFKLNLRSIRE